LQGLVGLFEEVPRQRLVRLLSVPRASSRPAQPVHDLEEVEHLLAARARRRRAGGNGRIGRRLHAETARWEPDRSARTDSIHRASASPPRFGCGTRFSVVVTVWYVASGRASAISSPTSGGTGRRRTWLRNVVTSSIPTARQASFS